MAVAVEIDNAGGQFSHMHLILTEKEYRIATKDSAATIKLLKKPPEVNPKFKVLKKEELTKYKVLQLDAEKSKRSQHTSPKKKQRRNW